MTLRTALIIATLAGLLISAPARATDIEALNIAPAIGEMALGPADAELTIIEYASPSCPVCAAFQSETFARLKAAYIDTGKLRFVLRDYPHNAPGMAASILARCAPKSKYFWLMDQFLKRQIEWVRTPHEGLLQIATEAGLSEDQFNACESDQQTLEDIASIRDRAKQLGVRGVPTFFVNGQMVEGDPGFKALKKRLDGLLETAAKTN